MYIFGCLKEKNMLRKIFILVFFVVQIFVASQAIAEGEGRYQVVAGSGENAYLVDTAQGFVWILSYRTLATGREPVVIPYRFLGLTPKSQRDFLMENVPVGVD